MNDKEINWRRRPTMKDWNGAEEYLRLRLKLKEVKPIIEKMEKKSDEDDFVFFQVKDLLRSSREEALEKTDPIVQKELKIIHSGKSISPILLVRNDDIGDKLIIADGDHRVHAFNLIDPEMKIKCIIVSA